MVEWHHPTRLIRLLVAVVAATAGCLVTACQLSGTRDYVIRWYFEVVNEADDGVRVRVAMRSRGPLPETGTLDLETGERKTFRRGSGLGFTGRPSSESGYQLIWEFGGLDFYDDASDVPYRSYVYRYASRCEPSPCDGSFWTGLFRGLFIRSDGVEELLFVESPERPFYLELDKEDRNLGRLVITFVPSAEANAGGVGC